MPLNFYKKLQLTLSVGDPVRSIFFQSVGTLTGLLVIWFSRSCDCGHSPLHWHGPTHSSHSLWSTAWQSVFSGHSPFSSSSSYSILLSFTPTMACHCSPYVYLFLLHCKPLQPWCTPIKWSSPIITNSWNFRSGIVGESNHKSGSFLS